MKSLQCQELAGTDQHLEHFALVNDALVVRKNHDVPGLGNEQQKKRKHRNIQMGSSYGLGIEEASYSIQADSVLGGMQHSLALKKHA